MQPHEMSVVAAGQCNLHCVIIKFHLTRELGVQLLEKSRNKTSRVITIRTRYLTCKWSNQKGLKQGYDCGDVFIFRSTSVIGIGAWYLSSYLPRKHSNSLRYIAKIVSSNECPPYLWRLPKFEIKLACNTNGVEGKQKCPKCGKNQICRSYQQYAECDCASGFIHADGECIDVNECSRKIHLCDQNARCINTYGLIEVLKNFQRKTRFLCMCLQEWLFWRWNLMFH